MSVIVTYVLRVLIFGGNYNCPLRMHMLSFECIGSTVDL